MVKNYDLNGSDNLYCVLEALGIFLEVQNNLKNEAELLYGLESVLSIDRSGKADNVFTEVIHAYNIVITYYDEQEKQDELISFLKEYDAYLNTVQCDYHTLRGMYGACWNIELFDHCNELARRYLYNM